MGRAGWRGGARTHMAVLSVWILLAPALAGCLDGANDPAGSEQSDQGGPWPAGNDAVVVAVIDFGSFNPYHFDWRSSTFPSHLDDDPANKLPFDRAPHEWLSGFPDPTDFDGYRPLSLTLPADPDANTNDLILSDEAVWDGLGSSTSDAVAYHYIPGTKVVGFIDFGGAGSPVGNSTNHAARAGSATAGNLFGTCPECLIVYIHHDGTEAPIEWALRQPWIDVITNSYGLSSTNTGTSADRHFVYSGCDVDLQRMAVERGQAIFWGAGNGLDGAGLAPWMTLPSCQFGPDWIFTVGGIAPSGGSQSWANKPVDIAAPSEGHPTQGGDTVNGTGTMGGTSVASPVSAGTYARAVWAARGLLEGPSRVQSDGRVAVGTPLECKAAGSECELNDGVLTGREMRTRFFEGAAHTPEGMKVVNPAPPVGPPIPEAEFLAEGHGSYWGRMQGDDLWLEEHERIVGAFSGLVEPLERPPGEQEWFVVDSFCRQETWGPWAGGDYVAGETQLPGPDPLWPLRSAYETGCPDEMFGPDAWAVPWIQAFLDIGLPS